MSKCFTPTLSHSMVPAPNQKQVISFYSRTQQRTELNFHLRVFWTQTFYTVTQRHILFPKNNHHSNTQHSAWSTVLQQHTAKAVPAGRQKCQAAVPQRDTVPLPHTRKAPNSVIWLYVYDIQWNFLGQTAASECLPENISLNSVAAKASRIKRPQYDCRNLKLDLSKLNTA